jgi:hypothetical protein
MDSYAVLGPVDPQLGDFPAASLTKAVRAKDVNQVQDKMLFLAGVGEESLQKIRSEVSEESRARLAPALTAAPSWMSDRSTQRSVNRRGQEPAHAILRTTSNPSFNRPADLVAVRSAG